MHKLKGQCTIKLGGKDRLMIFDFNALGIFCECFKCEFEDIDNILASYSKIRAIPYLFFAALVSAEERQGTLNGAPDYDPYKVSEWLGEVKESELNKALETLSASREVGDSSTVLNNHRVKEVSEEKK